MRHHHFMCRVHESTEWAVMLHCCILPSLNVLWGNFKKKQTSFVPIRLLGDRVLLRDQTGWPLMSNVAMNCVCTFAHVSFQQLHCSGTPRESEWSSFYSVKRIKTQHNTTHNFYAVKFGTAGLGPLEAQFYLFGFTGFLPSSALQEKVHMSLGSNNQTRDKYLHV